VTFTHWDSIIAATPALVAAWWSHRNGKRINEVHLLVNSRLTELLEATRTGAFSEGQQREREDQGKREEGKTTDGSS